MGRGRTDDEGRPVDPGEARTGGHDPDAVEVHRRGDSGYDEGRQRADGLGPDIPASGPGIAEGVAAGTAGQRITREEMRRAARDGVVDREEELKSDGAYGSSTSDPILPAELAELPPLALETTKRAADVMAEASREAGMLIERLAYAALAQTPEAQGAVEEFTRRDRRP